MAPLPLLLSLVLFGMPHGAVDHLVPSRLARRAPPVAQRGVFLSAYVGLVLAGLGLWVVAPGAALVLFLVLTVVHWGEGDLWFARHVAGRAPPRRGWTLAATWAARGLLPVAGILLAAPDRAAAELTPLLGAFGGGAPELTLAPSAHLAGLLALGAIMVVAVLASFRDHAGGPPAPLARDLLELALLGVLVATSPPLLAVGLYFLAWHSPRHVVRLMALEPAQARLLAAGRPVAALARFARDATPNTAIALFGLALLAVASGIDPTRPTPLLAVALPLIAALTLPHALVVVWMDHHQGVWARSTLSERPPAPSSVRRWSRGLPRPGRPRDA